MTFKEDPWYGYHKGAYYEEEFPDDRYDDVSKPSHYAGQGIEAKDYIKQVLGEEGWRKYCLGAVMKYIHRHEYKGNPVQDLEKAHTYLGWAIDSMKGE